VGAGGAAGPCSSVSILSTAETSHPVSQPQFGTGAYHLSTFRDELQSNIRQEDDPVLQSVVLGIGLQERAQMPDQLADVSGCNRSEVYEDNAHVIFSRFSPLPRKRDEIPKIVRDEDPPLTYCSLELLGVLKTPGPAILGFLDGLDIMPHHPHRTTVRAAAGMGTAAPTPHAAAHFPRSAPQSPPGMSGSTGRQPRPDAA